jgi:hypothetical protein
MTGDRRRTDEHRGNGAAHSGRSCPARPDSGKIAAIRFVHSDVPLRQRQGIARAAFGRKRNDGLK